MHFIAKQIYLFPSTVQQCMHTAQVYIILFDVLPMSQVYTSQPHLVTMTFAYI